MRTTWPHLDWPPYSDRLADFTWEMPVGRTVPVAVVDSDHWVFDNDNTSVGHPGALHFLEGVGLFNHLCEPTDIVIIGQLRPFLEPRGMFPIAIFYDYMDADYKSRYVMTWEELNVFHTMRGVIDPRRELPCWTREGF